MVHQKTSTIVPLIKKQPDGIALVETHLERQPIFQNRERAGRRFAQHKQRGGLFASTPPNIAVKKFMIYAACAVLPGKHLQQLPLPRSQWPTALGQQEVAQLFHKQIRPTIARTVN